jgi:thioredoxin 1
LPTKSLKLRINVNKLKHMIHELNSQNFKAEVLDFKGLVLVDFWAAWCGPCRRLAPELEMIEEEVRGDETIKFAKLDVDANPELSQTYQIRGIPNVIIFKDGQPVEQIIGLNLRSVYKEAISKHSV